MNAPKAIQIAVLLCLIPLFSLAQQDSAAIRFSQTITANDLRSYLTTLASDEMEGRETGEPGQKMAAAYIEERFKEFGYAPISDLNGYQQEFRLQLVYPDTVRFRVGEEELRFLKDMYYFPGFGDMFLQADSIRYVGYGISARFYDDYKNVDVKDRVIMISTGEPRDKNGKSLIDPEKESTVWTNDWRLKIKVAEALGAKAVLIIDDNFSTSVVHYGRYIKRPSITLEDSAEAEEGGLPVIYISSKMADKIMKKGGWKKGYKKLEKRISKKKEPQSVALNVSVTLDVKKNREEKRSENVLAYLEGTDKKEELLVITAHYDHLGKNKKGEIFNGADDDGSGTSALLELAEAFSLAKAAGHGPRRSILFMTVSGEEKGLLGSEFYTNNPVFPLENTVADLNIDMIGRIDEQHAPDSNYVYIIGSDKLSTELHQLNEQVNATYTGIDFDYTYNDENDPNRFYYRSDHYNFAKNNIPVIFYFTGVHEDYHQPTDTVDKIMFQKMERIARLVFHTAWEIANREQRLKVDVK